MLHLKPSMDIPRMNIILYFPRYDHGNSKEGSKIQEVLCKLYILIPLPRTLISSFKAPCSFYFAHNLCVKTKSVFVPRYTTFKKRTYFRIANGDVYTHFLGPNLNAPLSKTLGFWQRRHNCVLFESLFSYILSWMLICYVGHDVWVAWYIT